MKRNVFYTILVGISLIVAGFIRDYVFLNLNAQIDYLEGYPFNYTHPAMMWLDSGGYTVQQIINIKWVATVLFAGLFMLLTLLGIHFYWRNADSRKYVYWLYLGLLVFSALSYLLGTEILGSYYGYRFARIFMGFAQSPVPFMILFSALYLKKASNKKPD
jgi:ABC-type uncharacterized transport system YnjBCD permease subunit